MKQAYLRRAFATASLLLITCAGVRAQSFVGSTTVDLNARGFAAYNIEINADTVGGGNDYAYAWANYAGISGYSQSYISEAEVYLHVDNIHKVGSQWIADSVEIWEFNKYNDGQYATTYLSNVAIPNSSTIDGGVSCAGYTSPVYGNIYGYGTPANNPPVPSIAISGHPSGSSVSVNTSLTVTFGATDPDGNLNGIRYNAYNASTGYLDNNGGSFIGQSGGSGTVNHTFTLSSAGDWYFWTDASDTAGATASTPTYTAGYHIVVNNTTYCTPAYEPNYWNDMSTIQDNNNCYNYSNNRRTDTFAQPGRASGHMYTQITGAEVSNGAIWDGLEQTTAGATSPEGKTKIALVIWPGVDFHWYRQDSDGRWSHKPGSTEARNYDQSGNLISNPETADRGDYTEFVGYFFTPSDCAQGQGHANIN